MDTYRARSIWDKFVNQDPREFRDLSAGYKRMRGGRISIQDAVTEDVNEYIGQLDEMFPGEEISESDADELREAMRVVLRIVYEESPQVMLDGRAVDYRAAENLMDDDLREEIHNDLAPCTEQEFMDEYARRHAERFGSEFVVG